MLAPKNNLIYRHWLWISKKSMYFFGFPTNHLKITGPYGWFSIWSSYAPPGASAVPSPLWSHFHHDPGRVKIVVTSQVDGQFRKRPGVYVLQNKHIYISNLCQTMLKTYNSWSHVIHVWFLDSCNRPLPKKRISKIYIRRSCCVISLMSLKKSCILRSIKRPWSFYQHTPENTKA